MRKKVGDKEKEEIYVISIVIVLPQVVSDYYTNTFIEGMKYLKTGISEKLPLNFGLNLAPQKPFMSQPKDKMLSFFSSPSWPQ